MSIIDPWLDFGEGNGRHESVVLSGPISGSFPQPPLQPLTFATSRTCIIIIPLKKMYKKKWKIIKCNKKQIKKQGWSSFHVCFLNLCRIPVCYSFILSHVILPLYIYSRYVDVQFTEALVALQESPLLLWFCMIDFLSLYWEKQSVILFVHILK